jgi:formylglycine-generating enzyme required for sulfatase activity
MRDPGITLEPASVLPLLGSMAWIPPGSFLMGSNKFYPEERPVQRVSIDGFWIDRYPVTNADFSRFAASTGYRTVAERSPNPAEYPEADPALLVPGSFVFRKTRGRVSLQNYFNWWRYVPGACWNHPEGPNSSLEGRENHPVVQIAYADAKAYAHWAGKELPSEAEWEFAARGGLDAATFAWGNDWVPEGKPLANTWEGEFPWQNLKHDGYEGTSPVGAYPPNGYGLFDMAGNVWEWTCDYFAMRSNAGLKESGVPHNPRVTSPDASFVSGRPGAHIPRKVIKGGSHLCAPNYSLRFRPAARQCETIDTSTSHIGFRCVVRGS